MPEAVLLIAAGFQVPTIPFGEVVAKFGTELPLHIVKGVTLKSGVMLFVTVALKVTDEAHCPAFGVKI